jgi:nucleotide-binding universal stress UspA family protein
VSENVPTAAQQEAGVVAVGVDGSRPADDALAFALAEARRRGSKLRVVIAWHVPASALAGGLGAAPGFTPTDMETAARDALDEAIARAGAAAQGIEIETRVREGHPSDVLVNESADADLLIVGSRGLGGFRGMLLGSVSHECAHHARCPVLIIRSPRPHSDAAR